jgi:hypothetical protein
MSPRWRGIGKQMEKEENHTNGHKEESDKKK